MNKFIKLQLKGIVLVFIFSVVNAQTIQESVENQYLRMSKLINESSGAKQVINSDNAGALAKRTQALELQKEARGYMQEKDYDAASNLLKLSAKIMFEAIRQATPSSVMGNKLKDDYAKRRESVVALRDAFNRISDENNERENKKKTIQQVSEMVAYADAQLSRGENIEARQELDKAYHLLKVSIEYIRAGQTLVRSLNFPTSEEEYIYELDRNETHNMLVGLLIGEKKKSSNVREKIATFVNEAKVLRKQADEYADEKDFEKAIELLEASTSKLVRAIRVAGVFIPG